MKMQQDHFEYLQNKINAFFAKHGKKNVITAYESGNFPKPYVVNDLQRRFCFDMVHASIHSSWVSDNLYGYLNDDHIYTALKMICPKVERKF